MKAYYAKANMALGELYVVSTERGLCKIKLQKEDLGDFFQWLNKNFSSVEESFEKNEHIINQLQAYGNNELKTFQMDLHLIGTSFQKRVWEALRTIPYGSVCSYKTIAEKVGCSKGFRAVGMANNKNNIPIIIPCHRVIGSKGQLVGYGGGLEMKKRLLQLEGVSINEGKAVTTM